MVKNSSPLLLLSLLLVSGCTTIHHSTVSTERLAWKKKWNAENPVWRGLHVGIQSDRQADRLIAQFPRLTNSGVNAVIVEVDYGFQFQTHPELRYGRGLSREGAARLKHAAMEHGIWLIPQFNAFGHQSEGKDNFPLLAKYPQCDETPGKFPGNKGIYCRSWCPRSPELHPIVFSLIDEIATAFDADTIHIGMDEVFIIADADCPRCHGIDPAKLFADEVNAFHEHVVRQRGLEMMMWGDRLLDAKTVGNSKWESSTNGTAPAIRHIAKDIIICDWHYGKQDYYASLPIFTSRGFRTWPAGWQPLAETMAFSRYAHTIKSPLLKGFLVTTWGKTTFEKAADWPPLVEPLKTWR